MRVSQRFDPDNDPQTQEQIDRRRDDAEDRRQRLRKSARRAARFFAALCVLLVAGIAFLLRVTLLYETSPASLVPVVITAIACVLFFFPLCQSIPATAAGTLAMMLANLALGQILPPTIAFIDAVPWVIPCLAVLLGIGLAPIWLHIKYVGDPSQEIDSLIASLNPIPPGSCPRMLQWCREHEPLAKYQAKVARLDRTFTVEEENAVEQWVQDRESRMRIEAKTENERKACLALRDPIT